ncbi:MAG: hypothetical protein V4805_10535 [Pseudomonadota bacterium]
MKSLSSLLKKVSCLSILISLVACVQMPKQAFNRSVNTDIKTIAILEPATLGEIDIVNLGHPGLGFGLIGAMIAGADRSAKTDEFTKMAKEKLFDYVSEYKSNLTKALENVGYTVTTIPVKRTSSTGFMKSYGDLDPSVDAYLDIGLMCGFFSASATADYIPTVRSEVRLIKRKTKEVLYQEIVSYGYDAKFLEAISIPADEKYYFKDFVALKGNADAAIVGLRTGLPLVADQIANDIRQ